MSILRYAAAFSLGMFVLGIAFDLLYTIDIVRGDACALEQNIYIKDGREKEFKKDCLYHFNHGLHEKLENVFVPQFHRCLNPIMLASKDYNNENKPWYCRKKNK